MRRQLGFGLPLSFAVASILVNAGCGLDGQTESTDQKLCGCESGHDGGGSQPGSDGGTGGTTPPQIPPHLSMAEAAPVLLSVSGAPFAALGGSWAWHPGNDGPNTGTIPGDILLPGSLVLPSGSIPFGNIVHLGTGGLLTSVAQASSPIDTHAASGALGDNLTFDPGINPSQPVTIDLVALGGPVLGTAGLLDQASLTFGAFAAETGFVNGVLQPDHYRVAQADLLLRSPLVKDAAGQLYQAIGALDNQIEQIVNCDIGNAIQGLTGSQFPVPRITVTSNVRDKVFAALLAHPITSHNQVVTIDLSTGTVTVHLDQLAHGGLNNQPPNTELINSADYPLIASSIHDIMHDMTNIVLGAVEGSLDAVAINLTWAGPVGPLGDTLDVSWNFSLKQAVTGTMGPATNNSTGVVGGTLGTTLVTTLNTLTTAGNAVGKLFLPAYNLVIAHAGDGVFDLLINQIKFGFTSSVVNALQPVFSVLAQVVSVQVNHQTTRSCMNGAPYQHSLSALSVGILQSTNAARLDLGEAASSITLPSCVD